MTLKELREVCRHAPVELYDSKNGRLVAATVKSLDKYDSVEVCSAYPKIKLSRFDDSAHSFLYVFGSYTDICDVKRGNKK